MLNLSEINAKRYTPHGNGLRTYDARTMIEVELTRDMNNYKGKRKPTRVKKPRKNTQPKVRANLVRHQFVVNPDTPHEYTYTIHVEDKGDKTVRDAIRRLRAETGASAFRLVKGNFRRLSNPVINLDRLGVREIAGLQSIVKEAA